MVLLEMGTSGATHMESTENDKNWDNVLYFQSRLSMNMYSPSSYS